MRQIPQHMHPWNQVAYLSMCMSPNENRTCGEGRHNSKIFLCQDFQVGLVSFVWMNVPD